MQTLTNKIAWITGAGTGIGLSGAQMLAKAGALVVMSGRRADVLEKEAEKIRAAGGRAETLAVDVSDRDAATKAGETILARHGRVDILVNSAGMNVPNRFFSNQTPAGFDSVISANLNGTFYTVAAVLPAMRKQRDGLIINVSSWAGRYAAHMTGAGYNAAKAGVIALTTSINMEECGNNIRACALCPGEVATPIMLNRPIPPSKEALDSMLQADDLGRIILFLVESPAHMCVNEILVSPTTNRIYLGTTEKAKT